MPVSSWLQKYFDSQRAKKWDLGQKFKDLAWKIDPAFIASFESFHDKIMDIVEETPHSEEMICEELSDLSTQLDNSNRTHDMKKASSIIDIANG